MNRMRLLGLALALLGAGCAAPSPASTRAAANVGKLTQGLTGAQVRELLGDPTTTKPITTESISGQIWSYPVKSDTSVNTVATSTRSVPAVNPLTGRDTTSIEPVFEQQAVTTEDTLHLLMVDDRLVEWRIVRKQNGKFD